ncbi:hypothetical protein DI53_1885 [Sphingobacterium deserti]|uniref:Uncharacterized protein n=1 Tax=Sphingobacterium deserti TaxID=1229276 RepID=A0A0B8T120_9SPHI|nr:hypothetical protein DI53_1885 [Sphingobacterium deserti]
MCIATFHVTAFAQRHIGGRSKRDIPINFTIFVEISRNDLYSDRF